MTTDVNTGDECRQISFIYLVKLLHEKQMLNVRIGVSTKYRFSAKNILYNLFTCSKGLKGSMRRIYLQN